MRGFKKKPAELLERERAQRHEEAIAKGKAIVEASNAALEARLAQLRERRLREKEERRARDLGNLVARVRERWGRGTQEALA